MSFSATIKNVVRRARREVRTWAGRDFRAEPDVAGPRVFLGSEYGGWWVNPDLLSRDAVVFGVGVGTDVTFDLALIERFGCTVHAFDPTPKSIAWVKANSFPPRFQFHPVGLSDADGELLFTLPGAHPTWASYAATPADSVEAKTASDRVTCPVRRLDTLLRDLRLPAIDLLKMDIEGAEYAVVKDILAGPHRPRQLLIEYHYLRPEHRHNYAATVESVRLVREAGYRILARSPVGLEFSFIYDRA